MKEGRKEYDNGSKKANRLPQHKEFLFMIKRISIQLSVLQLSAY